MAGTSSGTDDVWSTRDSILLEASRLFATRGFRGTSTRDICAAVGIRQPSLYSHFASKQSIAEELLRRDLTLAIEALERVHRDGGGPAVELYRYLRWEITYDIEDPFDKRALYNAEILELPELDSCRELLEKCSDQIEAVIRRGIVAGDFIDLDVVFLRRTIDAISIEAMRGSVDQTPIVDQPDLAATLVTRALLRDTSLIDGVRKRAHELGL
ncbi:MAG: TetR/AcrR family transcriptional regulator [Actinomycetes bacterium]|jgi:AcrR family transcriptional regulator